MPGRLRIRTAVLLIVTACSSSTPTSIVEAPAPAGIEEVRAIPAFGDPPLVGEIRIRPAGVGADWRYSVDLDGNGRADETGQVRLGVAIGYRFETFGPHRITIDLERGDERHRLERFVVVNDTTAAQVLAQVSLEEAGAGLAGVALDPRNRLFVLALEHLVFQLDSFTLATMSRLPIPGVRFPNGFLGTEGLALAGDDTLFVDLGDSLLAIHVLDEPSILGTVAPSHWGSQLYRRRDGLIYIGGGLGLALVDPGTGGVLASREGSGVFAVTPDERVVAVLQGFPGPDRTLFLLGADDLREKRIIRLGSELPSPAALSFNHRGDRIYAVFGGGEWRLLVIDPQSGRVLRDMTLGRDNSDFVHGVNPAAMTPDRRFVVLPTGVGAFFIDTREDLPRFRVSRESQGREATCCNVAASAETGVFYFAQGLGDAVTKVRLNR